MPLLLEARLPKFRSQCCITDCDVAVELLHAVHFLILARHGWPIQTRVILELGIRFMAIIKLINGLVCGVL